MVAIQVPAAFWERQTNKFYLMMPVEVIISGQRNVDGLLENQCRLQSPPRLNLGCCWGAWLDDLGDAETAPSFCGPPRHGLSTFLLQVSHFNAWTLRI